MTDPLVAFLRACLDEDARVARDAAAAEFHLADGGSWWRSTSVGDEYNVAVVMTGAPDRHTDTIIARCGVEGLENGEYPATHIARWDPARVLAEVEAKRRIIELHGTGFDPCDAHDASLRSIPCETLQLLALPYADRPGYDPAWKP